MIALNPEQVLALQAIALERDQARLAQALQLAFPEVAARLGERLAALIQLALQRATGYGLSHALAVARLLACWCALGAEFETKPGREWALALLGDSERSERDKVFQLGLRVQEALAESGASAGPATAFKQGLGVLDRELTAVGALGSLLPREPLSLGQACDIDALELRQSDATLQLYQSANGTWQRVPAPHQPRPLLVQAGAKAGSMEELAAETYFLLPRQGRHTARLRLRAGACCEAHPLVRHLHAGGVQEWRGAQALELAIALPALAPKPPLNGTGLGLGLVASAQYSQLTLQTCGLRASGAALGEQATQLALVPADQHLLAWQRDTGAALHWSEAEPVPAASPTGKLPACRYECDGLALNASAWEQGLQKIDLQLRQGLDQLYRAWARESGVSQPQMTAEPALLAGNAGLSWGLVGAPDGLAQRPTWRLAGQLELLACRLKLVLSGQLALGGASCLLSLSHSQETSLQVQWDCADAQTDLAGVLRPASCSFAQPLELRLENLASRSLSSLAASGPLKGQLTGSFGLRARSGQAGLEWFAKLALEPVSLPLQLAHPMLGLLQFSRPLLPALTLLDWSLG